MANLINTTARKVYAQPTAEAVPTSRVFTDSDGTLFRIYVRPVVGAAFTSELIAYLVDATPSDW